MTHSTDTFTESFKFRHRADKKTLYTWLPDDCRVSWDCVNTMSTRVSESQYTESEVIGYLKEGVWIIED